MYVPTSDACAGCNLVFGTNETRVAHNGKPYHEQCVEEARRKKQSPRFRIADLLMIIDRQGIRIEPKHRFGR